MAWFPERLIGWGFLVAVLSTCGITTLLGEMGRDQGKKKEGRLFELWGGKPTTKLLRHKDGGIDSITKQRYHQKLLSLIPGIKIPTTEEETENPGSADDTYGSCVRYLIEKTRDKERFPLVYKELTSYGFRRNLWAMKPVGLILSLIGVIASSLPAIFPLTNALSSIAFVAIILNVLIFVWWVSRITPGWVKSVAYAYANALIASCDILQ